MLSAEDIQDLVNGGEGYNVDFKRSVPYYQRTDGHGLCSIMWTLNGVYLRKFANLQRKFVVS